MRTILVVSWLFLFSAAVFAEDPHINLKIKVIDPQSAAVAGARVELLPEDGFSPSTVRTTTGDGLAIFSDTPVGHGCLRVLAPGFAAQSTDVSPSTDSLTVQLRLATAAETVVVTATRTPVTSDDSGASVTSLSGGQLETMQPVTASDALRFLPGAIVNSAGQRGGLSSLFVRGGDSNYNTVWPGRRHGKRAWRDLRLWDPSATRSRAPRIPARSSEHALWLRCHDQRGAGLDADWPHCSARASFRSRWRRIRDRPAAIGPCIRPRALYDYNFFGDQFNTNGQGLNDRYSDSLQGGNVGIELSQRASLRFRVRHSNSHTGLPGEGDFNGNKLQPPDPAEWSQLNTLLGSAELTAHGPSGWEHRLTAFDYNYRYTDVNLTGDSLRIFDIPRHESDHINRGIPNTKVIILSARGHTRPSAIASKMRTDLLATYCLRPCKLMECDLTTTFTDCSNSRYDASPLLPVAASFTTARSEIPVCRASL